MAKKTTSLLLMIAWLIAAPALALPPSGPINSGVSASPKTNTADTANTQPGGAKPKSKGDSESEPKSTGYGKTHGLLGPVTLGPTIGIAIPHPANVGLEGRYLDIVGFAFNYGFLPQITLKGNSAKINSWDIRARIFPFRGGFFLGVAYGNQELNGSRSEQIAGSPQSTSVTISTTTLTPHFGWRWVYDAGFVWGFDFGVQLAQSNSTVLKTSASLAQQADPLYQELVDDLNELGDKIGKQMLPFVTLLHVGYMF